MTCGIFEKIEIFRSPSNKVHIIRKLILRQVQRYPSSYDLSKNLLLKSENVQKLPFSDKVELSFILDRLP